MILLILLAKPLLLISPPNSTATAQRVLNWQRAHLKSRSSNMLTE